MEMTKTRCIFWDWKEPLWYLGERVVRQHSSDTFLVPRDPPDSMLDSVLLASALGQGRCYGGPGADYRGLFHMDKSYAADHLPRLAEPVRLIPRV